MRSPSALSSFSSFQQRSSCFEHHYNEMSCTFRAWTTTEAWLEWSVEHRVRSTALELDWCLSVTWHPPTQSVETHSKKRSRRANVLLILVLDLRAIFVDISHLPVHQIYEPSAWGAPAIWHVAAGLRKPKCLYSFINTLVARRPHQQFTQGGEPQESIIWIIYWPS